MITVEDLVTKAAEAFGRMTNTPPPTSGIVGVNKVAEGWVVLLEVLMRKAIPDTMDLLAIYEIRLDDEGNLLGFDRKKLRKRCESVEV